MPEKKMLIVDSDVVSKIDDNRGDMSRSEFINLLIDTQLKGGGDSAAGASREEFLQFQEDTRELLRSFLEFFISYGLELGKQPKDREFEQLSRKLQSLGK